MPRASSTKTPARAPDRATQYARDVTDGRIVAGPHVRAACRRHLADLNAQHVRGWRWDLEDAEKAIAFFEGYLKLNGGQFEGLPFTLLPWQAFIVGSLFGWKIADTGHRRYKIAFIETAKGSGKSPLAAGIGLKCLTSDREPRAEVYAAASKQDQAMVLFRDAVAMVKQSPLLRPPTLELSGGDGREWNIAYLKTGGFFRAISSESGQSGPRPHCALLDEVHEHRDDGVVEMMIAGQKFRRQPLVLMITNSGTDRTGVCWRYHEAAIKIAHGVADDPSFFSYVCALDDGDDPLEDDGCWPKANPSLGETITDDYLRRQVNGARGMPAREGIVLRLNFCVWTDAVADWIGKDVWDSAEADFDPDELHDVPCWLALDLSAKRDLTALSAVWKHDDDSLSLAAWGWTPADTMADRERKDGVPYTAWSKTGHLFATPGRIIDKKAVARFVQEFTQRHNVRALAYDQAQMDDFLGACDEIGLEAWPFEGEEKRPGEGLMLIRHGQGFAGYQSESSLWMPRSIEATEEAIIQRQCRIRRSPVLRYCSASAVVKSDEAGNRKWDKRKATGRIDLMVAASMAIGAARSGWGRRGSVYEERGILVF